MRSTFFGLEIGRKALQAQQRALDVTSHNIANANTAGYTRQEAVMAATNPFAVPSLNRPLIVGQMGTGVAVEEIRRIRDDFIDMQVRKESTSSGEWEARQDALNKLEVIINEPSDSSLRSVMDQFWQAFHTLSQKPEDRSVRAVVRQTGIALAETFNHMYKQLVDLQVDLDQSIEIKAGEINNIATQIRDLNDQIVRVEVSGDRANDLRDKRDLLIDELSKMVNVSVTEDSYGAVTVAIGGRALVMNQLVNKIVAVDNVLNNGYVDLKWEGDLTDVVLTGGLVKGMIDTRGYVSSVGPPAVITGIIPDYIAQLNTLTGELINEINNVHSTGFGLDGVTGYMFFAGTDARTIAVHTDIDDLDHIAAAQMAGAAGDGTNAVALAQIKNKNIVALSGTVDDYYRGIVSQLGVQAQAAKRMVENQNLLLSQLENNRQGVSGVSLDEEMTNMVKFQQAYNAAARVVTAMDEMLDTIVNRLGIVGR